MTGFESGYVIAAINTNVEEFKTSPFLQGVNYEKIEIIHKPAENDMGIECITLIHLKCNKPETVDAAVATLHQCPFVVFAEPNFTAEFHRIPNDPLFDEMYAMQRVNAPDAWHCVIGSPHVLVGVLDSGVDANHPDLRQNLRLTDNPEFRDFRDLTGHGTHVAGTVGATGNNHLGVTGVCWHVGMVVYKVGNDNVDLASAVSAINTANHYNIPILNCSWGSRHDSASLRFAVQQYKGLIVASAGNNGTNNDVTPMYPASYRLPNVISVAATNQNNQIAPFSNFGERNVHIAAPGTDILSTIPNNQYGHKSGTSMAAPHVAGAAALLKVFRPSISTEQMRTLILSTATRTPETNHRVSTGILNIGAMINAARHLDFTQ